MSFKVEYTESAFKDLKKLDKSVSQCILSWIKKNLEGCDNPRTHGKALVGNKAGQWRYRVGDYRVLAKIEDDKVLILVVAVGHRKDIYK